MKNKAMNLECWCDEEEILSPRSPLYHIPPVALGTGFVECFTSLLCRIGETHHLSTGNLINGFVIKTVKGIKDANLGRIKVLNASFRAFSVGLNGLGGLAESWTSAVGKLTGVPVVSRTTMLPLKQLLSQRLLLRPTRAWCPYCLEESKSRREQVYEPLLWCIAAVSACPVHKRLLTEECPACKARPAWIDSYARCGFCSKCRCWLGRPSRKKASDPTSRAWLNKVATAQAVAELLRAAQSGGTAENTTAKSLIQRMVDSGFHGVPAHFATAVGRNKSTIWGWQKGALKIPLPDLLDICFRQNTTPAMFLADSAAALPDRIDAGGITRPKQRLARARRSVFPYEKIKRRIQRLSASKHAVSVSRIALKLKVEKRVLYKFFPEDCKRIAERFRCHGARLRRAEIGVF